jgi:hypothetical protein
MNGPLFAKRLQGLVIIKDLIKTDFLFIKKIFDYNKFSEANPCSSSKKILYYNETEFSEANPCSEWPTSNLKKTAKALETFKSDF